jgi:hypothetical protein
MSTELVLPSHEALLARARPGIVAFVKMLTRTSMDLSEVALFTLDLRSAAGATAGIELLGLPWVAQRLTRDAYPVVVLPLSGLGDISLMASVVAPAVVGLLGRRPSGSIEVVLVNDRGTGALLWLDVADLLDGAG